MSGYKYMETADQKCRGPGSGIARSNGIRLGIIHPDPVSRFGEGGIRVVGENLSTDLGPGISILDTQIALITPF